MWTTIITLGQLVVGIFGLVFLIIYVRATKTIATQSVEQTEGQSRPAIVAKPGSTATDAPMLVNIGNGPAIDLKWSIQPGKQHDTVQYLEPQQPWSLGSECDKRTQSSCE